MSTNDRARGIMDYVQELEGKVREARWQRNQYRLLCIWYYWPYSFVIGVGVGVLVALIVGRIIRCLF
jgi:hypothetical protein